MTKTAKPYLEDIIESVEQIENYIQEVNASQDLFEENILVQDAVIRRLEIIGEATKRLEQDFRDQYEHIPWKQMAGLRDFLIHEYDEVDLDQIWLVLQDDLPILKQEISQILES